MNAMAAGLDEYVDYYIQKAEQDEIGFNLTGFDFVFMYVYKPIVRDAEKALIDFTNGGGSLIVLHHGIYPAFDLPDTEIFLNQRLKDDQIKVLLVSKIQTD